MHYVADLLRILVAAALPYANGQYQGILINGQAGTQLYDPYSTPAGKSIQLALPTGTNALGGAAAINGQMAYFGSNDSR
jgi:hypothetical protein